MKKVEIESPKIKFNQRFHDLSLYAKVDRELSECGECATDLN